MFKSNFNSSFTPTSYDFPSQMESNFSKKYFNENENFGKNQRNRTKSEPSNLMNVKQPCNNCGVESIFECNFCANLIRKGVNLEKIFFCSDCMKKCWKIHHKIHEKLSVEYKIFL
jgi:hypothetical protein